jgi:hypothetical protein
MGRALKAWDWARAIVRDTGQPEEVPVNLERAGGPGHADPDGAPAGEYVFRLGVRAGFGGQEIARIPIGRRPNPDPHPILKEIHFCEVAGRRLEAANVYALRSKVAALLESIAPGRALPLCYFRAPAMDYELPVYEHGGEVRAPVIGGPKLRAGDLAEIRRHVCRYLVSAGYANDVDEVTVGVLRPRDLRRVPPAAVFRSFDEPDVWLPSVEGIGPDGPVVGVLGRAARLRSAERERAGAGPVTGQSAPAAPDVVELLRYLRTEMARGGGLEDARTLYASEVRPEIWSAAERQTTDTGRRLVAYLSDDDVSTLELVVRATGFGEVVTALDDRGIDVFLATDEAALADAVGRYLAVHDFVRFPTEIEVRDVAAERPERLDSEQAWTSGGDYAAAAFATEPEEVRS